VLYDIHSFVNFLNKVLRFLNLTLTCSVALLESGSGCLELLMGHAVLTIEDCPDQVPADLSTILPSNASVQNGPSVEDVKSWLQTNRISVEEGAAGHLVVGGVVHLRPPYQPDMCTGDNELVVERVRELLRKIPSR